MLRRYTKVDTGTRVMLICCPVDFMNSLRYAQDIYLNSFAFVLLDGKRHCFCGTNGETR